VQGYQELAEHLSPVAISAMDLAKKEADQNGEPFVGTQHLLLALIQQESSLAREALLRLGADGGRVREAVESVRGSTTREQGLAARPRLSGRVARVLALAVTEAQVRGAEDVGPEHILLGLLAEGQGIAVHVLDELGISVAQVKQQLASLPARLSNPGAPSWRTRVEGHARWAGLSSSPPRASGASILLGPDALLRGAAPTYEDVRRYRAWSGPPDDVMPGAVAYEAVVAASADAVITISVLWAFPVGFECAVAILTREPRGHRSEVLGPFFLPKRNANTGHLEWHPGEQLDFAIRFADGRTAHQALTEHAPSTPTNSQPEEGVALTSCFSGISAQGAETVYWVWPLPPPGPIGFIFEWPALRVGRTVVEMESRPIREAASRAVELWSQQSEP